MKPFLDASNIVENGAELSARMARDGYLFIRGLLPTNTLEELRMALLDIARRAGWVKRDTPLADAIADLDGFCVEPESQYMDVYHQMYKLPEFHALQHHPAIIEMLERMLGEAVLPHARTIGRTLFPQREAFTTPAHQDFIPIQGTADTYTAWIPLHDLPAALGGLTVAAGSHRQGVYEFRPALGAGGLEVVDPLKDAWVYSPFEQGDVLFFHSMAVHKGMPNRSDRLRMSMDFRYQKASDPIAADSLEPHGKLITWDEVYADWPDTTFQYYWRKWDLQFQPYDFSYHETRDELALEMAANGDQTARSTLQRIVSRDMDPAKRQQAAELLAKLDAMVETA